MARAKNGPSKSKIFRQYFHDHPHLLDSSDNTEVYEMFKRDHPKIELDDKVKQVCANIKSDERRKQGRPKKRRKGGRKAAKAPAAVRRTTQARAKAAPTGVNTSSVLEDLEANIDTWVNTIKEIDPKGSGNVVKYLRRARNFVSLRLDALDEG